jgi:hypothetical protein
MNPDSNDLKTAADADARLLQPTPSSLDNPAPGRDYWSNSIENPEAAARGSVAARLFLEVYLLLSLFVGIGGIFGAAYVPDALFGGPSRITTSALPRPVRFISPAFRLRRS